MRKQESPWSTEISSKTQNTDQFGSNPFDNEIGRLSKRVGVRVEVTDTIFSLPHNNIPENGRKDVTYGRIILDYCSPKYDLYHTRLAVGVNLIKYPGEVSTRRADITMAKLLFDSTSSTPEASFVCRDIKNFYLFTPIECSEYICLTIDTITY